MRSRHFPSSAVYVPRRSGRPRGTNPPRAWIRVPVGKDLVVVELG